MRWQVVTNPSWAKSLRSVSGFGVDCTTVLTAANRLQAEWNVESPASLAEVHERGAGRSRVLHDVGLGRDRARRIPERQRNESGAAVRPPEYPGRRGAGSPGRACSCP